ncbi:hypothetical protein [Sphingobium chungangianum]
MTTELTTTTGTHVPPTVVMPTPYDTALSFMPVLLFIGALFAIIKGYSWWRDRTKKEAADTEKLVGRVEDLEGKAKAMQAAKSTLDDHERRLTVLETNHSHISESLGELKNSNKTIMDNLMDIRDRLPRKEG